jgi:tRNA-dihydrouridine synthase
MNYLECLPKPFFVLAPMDDVTDTVFRQIVAECARPDLFFTEFVNVEGLQSPGRSNLLRKLRFTPIEQPLIVQIWGKNPDNFYKTARELADGTFARELGLPERVNFSGIDLNMGCPDKTIVKNGTCSALINNRELALEIIQATQEGAAGQLPVSVKTRLGLNTIDLGWHEFLLRQKLDMLTIHLRTRKEMSKVPANWDAISQIRDLRDQLAPQTKIVGNGDVISHRQGLELVSTYRLDGIMIGRGIFHDPYVFARESPWLTINHQAKIDLFIKHVKLFADTWQPGERNIATLNKFCKVYINGFDGAKELRDHLMQACSTDELLALLQTVQAQGGLVADTAV